jgi:hypothetical protein
VLVYSIRESGTSPDHPLGASVDVFVHHIDAERFIQDVRETSPS